MKKYTTAASLVMCSALILGCRTEKVEKHREDGVEVIVNHISPYQLDEQPASLHLEQVTTVDTEDPEVAASGLIDINSFQVDSQGFVYFLSHRGEKHFFFKFTPQGQFVKAFGPRGQAPGEMEFPLSPHMLAQDRLAVTDVLKKSLVFDTAGNVVSEARIDPNFVIVNPLKNGNAVVFWKAGAEDAAAAHFNEKTSLFDPNSQEIRDLDVLGISQQVRLLDPIYAWHIHGNKIYHLNEQRGYEIFVYDGDGTLLRKIRKEYEPVRLTPEFRKDLLEGIPEDSPLRDPAVSPDFLPPILTLFTDDEGRIYSVTFEKGMREDEHRCDVFTPEGIFFTRINIPLSFSRDPFPIHVLIKSNKLYCVNEKANGYQQLQVFQMHWKQ